MTAVARGIDETRNAVQLNGFFWEKIYLFSQTATLPVYLFDFYLSIYFSILPFFSAEYFFNVQFSLNIARTLGRAVNKLLNGSRFYSHWQFIFRKQSLSLFRRNSK